MENFCFFPHLRYNLVSVRVRDGVKNSVLFDKVKCLIEKNYTIIAHGQEMKYQYIVRPISKAGSVVIKWRWFMT